MDTLAMQVRGVDEPRREVTGIVAPYDETTYLIADPRGERLRRGCFAKSIRERGSRVLLCVGHQRDTAAVGRAEAWEEGPDGLRGTFRIRDDQKGDEVLTDCREGYLPAMSVAFAPTRRTTGQDGVVEILEARLHEVSLVAVGAYDGAQVLAVRSPAEVRADLAHLLAPFQNPPRVDLSPLPPIYPR